MRKFIVQNRAWQSMNKQLLCTVYLYHLGPNPIQRTSTQVAAGP